MSTEDPIFDPQQTPGQITSALSSLQSALAPLIQKKWADTLEPLSPMERAKMNAMMAYTIVDLIWVYLKMRGIDPEKHEVSGELERVRGYYAKIRAIEAPETRRNKVDAAAAGRFIKHAIPSKQRLQPVGSEDTPSTSAAGAVQASKNAIAGQKRQREVAVGDPEEDAIGGRMAGRWRFVADSAERVAIGAGSRSDQENETLIDRAEEDSGDQDVEMGGDIGDEGAEDTGDDEESSTAVPGDEAEMLLSEISAGISAQSSAEKGERDVGDG